MILTELMIHLGHVTTSSEGSPCPTEDERCDLHDPKDGFRKKRILKRQVNKETQGNIYIFIINHIYMIMYNIYPNFQKHCNLKLHMKYV